MRSYVKSAYPVAMSIYSRVSDHNSRLNQPSIADMNHASPCVSTLNDKGTTFAAQTVNHVDDSLAEYFSDDEEREKALQLQKEKTKQVQQNKEKET